MVAYSFKIQFIAPIVRGLEPGPLMPGIKRQTIRADRKRHARPGEEVQLYFGMRTKHCKSIGVVRCTQVQPIVITFDPVASISLSGGTVQYRDGELDEFALLDGFDSWNAMRHFWRHEHSDSVPFTGVLIKWKPLS